MRTAIALVSLSLLVAGCGEPPAPAATPMDDGVDGAVLATPELGEWLTYGRTYDEQRFSPLTQVTADNLDDLGLAWYYDTGQYRGHESTALVHDDVLYITSTWSIVHALDARTGARRWVYDPQVPRGHGRMVCCDAVNRGAALWDDGVFVGTVDGRLVRIDAQTGAEVWAVDTRVDNIHYSITGAPRIVKGKVIIGNGGAELGARGYVSAYDADSGQLAWRFWTVPGNPDDPIEHPALEAALPTWTGEWWEVGGGGTVWDALTYDPELDLLYVGTGNGAPWSRALRSPGGGDNLYLSSILALDPDTGDLIWHYQTTPGDNWDYTATQHIMLADLEIEGERRQVLMQAPKNGFFYVLDRKTGELLSAQAYARVTWASHVDMTTGRPVEIETGDYDGQSKHIFPSALGGHNWQPMAFNADLGLVYIPKQDMSGTFTVEKDYEFETGVNNNGNWLPPDEADAMFDTRPEITSYLLAWDPVSAQGVWEVEVESWPNGGALATASGLVMQGTSGGRFVIYDGATGEQLRSIDTSIGIIAPPMTYMIDGTQYVAVLAGSGGAGIRQAEMLRHKQNMGRLMVFALGATASMPEVPDKPAVDVTPPENFGTPEQVADGRYTYHKYCARCHGRNASSNGIIRDLRHAAPSVHQNWNAIVLEGLFEPLGMAGFADVIGEGDAQAIRSYVVSQANLPAQDDASGGPTH